MASAFNRFRAANRRFRKADYARWHQLQSKRHILRSQLGFQQAIPSRPTACVGCMNYHGLAYGQSGTRTVLVCGFYPHGWVDSPPCPEWTTAA
ncbi:MAG: hypothetical protein ACFB5Z_10765 [Elainellaceae cyanobacterium]